MNPATSAVALPPGAIADLVNLYTPAPARAVLATLLALEQEVRTSARPGLEHAIAHVRLEWWQAEAERTRAGQASHPLTRSLTAALGAQAVDLRPLIHSTRLELAGLAGADEPTWQLFFEGSLGTLYVLLGQALGSAAGPQTLRRLGGAVQELSTARAVAPARLGAALAQLPAPLQPALRPLLVWAALVGWRTARGLTVADEQAPGGLRLALAQQWVAWRAARAALSGRFGWPWPLAAASPTQQAYTGEDQ